MKVWGSHTKGMDHLQRRAEQHLGSSRTAKSSRASKMEPLSMAERRKALYEQRSQSKFHRPDNGSTSGSSGGHKGG